MSDYFDPEDEINKDIPPILAAEIVALQNQLSGKMKEVRRLRLDGLTAMPKCPECGSEVYRPKCFHELGAGCPRHDICTAYGGMHALGVKFGLVRPLKKAE